MTDQLHFDFDAAPFVADKKAASSPGYEAFDAEREKALRAVEERFGVMANKQVRVRLKGWDGEFTGKLVLDQLLVPSSRREELRLRIGQVTFDFADIEVCALL